MLSLFVMTILPLHATWGIEAGIFDKINHCEANRVLKGQKCATEAQINGEIARVCADPVKYACGKAPPQGDLLNSKCKINYNDNKNAAQTPEVQNLTNQIKQDESKFLRSHEKECPGSGSECLSFLRIKYVDELKNLQIQATYTPDRLLRVNLLFDEVKSTAIKLVQDSKKISGDEKTMILSRIKNTVILDPNMDTPNPCSYVGAEGADTAVFNSSTAKSGSVSTVNFCSGAIAMIDRESETSLLLTLTHELSHSFDPCMLDTLADVQRSQLTGDKVFSQINRCLRGGSGPRGCTEGKLHCNDLKNNQAFCAQQQARSKAVGYEACLDMTLQRPNCPWSANTDGFQDSSLFRSGPDHVDQTRESFADFMGAQIYSRMLKNRGSVHPLQPQDKLDMLVSVGADFASLHGICLGENTNDTHPPGRIRAKGTILINDELSHQLCPASKDAKCEGL